MADILGTTASVIVIVSASASATETGTVVDTMTAPVMNMAVRDVEIEGTRVGREIVTAVGVSIRSIRASAGSGRRRVGASKTTANGIIQRAAKAAKPEE